MSEGFSCSDKETLIAYIYDECEVDDRQRVETHLVSCASCSDEVSGARSVREALAAWTPAAAAPGFRIVREEEAEVPAGTVLRPARWWRRPLPVLARAAAAVLLFAGGAALANLDVHYGADGLSVRTGWRHAAPVEAARGAAPAAARVVEASAPWRSDLADLERRLRGDLGAEIQGLRAAPAARAASASQDDRQLLSRVNALVDQRVSASEQRQQREMAYQIAQVQSEFGVQRRADLLRVQANLGQLQGQTGEEVARQRQLINYLLTVSQKK